MELLAGATDDELRENAQRNVDYRALARCPRRNWYVGRSS